MMRRNGGVGYLVMAPGVTNTQTIRNINAVGKEKTRMTNMFETATKKI